MKRKISILLIFTVIIFLMTAPAMAGSTAGASAQQGQGQNQGQGQGQSQSSVNVVAPSQTNTQLLMQNFEAADPKRPYAYAPETSYPPLGTNFSKPGQQGHRTMRILQILKQKMTSFDDIVTFTRDEVEAIAIEARKGIFNGFDPQLRVFGKFRGRAPVDEVQVSFLPYEITYTNGKKTVKFLKQANMTMAGTWQGIATEDWQVTLDVLFVAMYDAMENGLNGLDIVAEGARWELIAQGIGIGMFYSHAHMGGEQNNSGVGGGGTGWSKSWSGYEDSPWLQCTMLVRE